RCHAPPGHRTPRRIRAQLIRHRWTARESASGPGHTDVSANCPLHAYTHTHTHTYTQTHTHTHSPLYKLTRIHTCTHTHDSQHIFSLHCAHSNTHTRQHI